MPLFQKSVLNKYLKEQDKEKLLNVYDKYRKYFQSPAIQQNILNSKEEQFQEGFLRELFVNIFGYTINPDPDFNLTTEFKNKTGAQKADGAILKEGNAVGVIELKSTKTKDLEKVRKQAFDYKANQPNCTYVITSNFQKLRFYINDAVDFEEFDLFILSPERFEVLFLCLSLDNILADIPARIKKESLLEEEKITKKFYADYSLFKKELFEDIAEKNDGVDGLTKLTLYKKTQKLLDRFLFIFFAEDRGLLPPNSISRMIRRWKVLQEEDSYKTLYQIYKQYFGYLNKGRKGRVAADDIHEYNGGLFLEDELLDRIEISDEVLLKHTTILTNYDFESQVDVNILGHIFEHSLNEIESITAELEGVAFDKQKSKRKKDGVFYTPKYITKYIVDNTVGRLCEEKKNELGIADEDYTPSRQKTTRKKLLDKLENYRNWLLEITICDPACGSGAFLNQALDFLIYEHHYIDELNAKLFGSTLVFQDVENQILENNIYGVDINEDSVDIAKLSLWLRTAHRGRKLTTLNKNIKCGNSLIDDPDIANEKAFNWENEFPDVFAKGGFDVVIGNPPYIPLEQIDEVTKLYVRTKFPQLTRKYDTSVVFKLRCLELTRENGYQSFITTITWQTGENYGDLRRYLFKNVNLKEIVNLPFNVFLDAYVDTGIYILRNAPFDGKYLVLNFDKKAVISSLDSLDFKEVNNEMYDEESWKIVLNPNAQKLLKRSLSNPNTVLVGAISKSTQGLSPSRYNIEGYEKEGYFPYLVKGQVQQYQFIVEELGFTDMHDKENLKSYYESVPKILIRRLINRQDRLTVAYNEEKCVFKKDINPFIVTRKDIDAKFVLAILASKLVSYLYVNTSSIATKDDFRQTTLSEIRQLPIIIPVKDVRDKFATKADFLITLNKDLFIILDAFLKFVRNKYGIQTTGKKLQTWHELDFKDFVKELKKSKVQLSITEEAEWMQYFNEQKQKAQELKAEIDRVDAEIDRMVYELYNLTEEEIQIVEKS